MNKEKILIALLSLRVLVALYYLPEFLKRMVMLIDSGLWNNQSFHMASINRYFFLSLGAIGLVQYFQNKNIYNPFLRIYFIFFLAEFFLNIPTLLKIYFIYGSKFNWSFYFFNALSIAIGALVIVLYRQRRIQLSSTTSSTHKLRFTHYIIDRILILSLIIQFGPAYRMFINFDIGYIVESFLAGLFIFVGYYVISETVFQQTIGKVLTKHYVARTGGWRAGFSQIFRRTLGRIIPFEAFSLLANPAKGWHDSLSETNVFPTFDDSQENKIEDRILEHLVEKEEI